MLAAILLALLCQPRASDQPSTALADLTSRATSGDPWASWLLYRVYADDIYEGTARDFELPADKQQLWDLAARAANDRNHAFTPADAAAWLKRSADAGNVLATDELADCYEHAELGFPKDDAKAFKLIKSAIDRGSYISMIGLASDFEDGTGGHPKEADQAAKYYAMAVPILQQHVAAGDNRAKLWLSRLYSEGLAGLPKDPTRAFNLVAESARGGNATAMVTAARMLLYGQGTAKDEQAAFDWIKRGVAHGSAGAMYRLALMIQQNQAPAYKPEDAAAWLQRAAERECAPAMYQLGQLYDTGGPGVAKDHDRAIELLVQADKFDYDFVAYDLACWARDAHNQPRDLPVAARWFQRAADLGSTDGMIALASMYDHGQGNLERDSSKAASLLQRAADLGSDEAMVRLAHRYASGRGVPKDPAKARDLVRQAADHGNQEAKGLLKRDNTPGH